MATYSETIAALRTWIAGLLAAESIPPERIFWDAFGVPEDDPPGPMPADPGSSIWARPVLSGEANTSAGGYSWVEKTGALVIELRCSTTTDEQASGMVDLASRLARAVWQETVDTVTFSASHVVPARPNKDAPHQLNVVATYTRVEFDPD